MLLGNLGGTVQQYQGMTIEKDWISMALMPRKGNIDALELLCVGAARLELQTIRDGVHC